MRALTAALLLCFVSPCFAQSCERQIIVNVRDSKGQFVPDLQASSFHAKVAGHDAPVTSANVFVGSNRLILVLDASGSMSGADEMKRWNAIKTLAAQIIAPVPNSSKLAVLVFNAQIVTQIGFDHSRKELVGTVEQLRAPKGTTALYDALLEARKMFNNPVSGDAVLVITDADDNSSRSTPGEVEKTFVTDGIRMFTVTLRTTSRFPQVTEEESFGPSILGNLSNATGGDTAMNIASVRKDLTTKNPDAFGSVVNQLIDEIAHFYVLQVPASMRSSAKLEGLDLTLLASDGRKSKGIALTYPWKLSSCTR